MKTKAARGKKAALKEKPIKKKVEEKPIKKKVEEKPAEDS